MRLPPATHLLLGFAGPKDEAEEIKRRLAQFLQEDLKLELSETKTLITHARTSAARFLGYEITTQHANRIITDGRRKANGSIRLRVPGDVIKAKCARYMSRGKPERRSELLNDEDHSIISRYGAEYRGIVQYYLLAGDVHRLDRLHWVMVTSLLKTLAAKYDSSVTKMARKYGATIETPYGPRRCIQVSVDRGEGRKPLVATFGGIPLRRQKNVILRDRESVPAALRRRELVHRLLAGRCELCGTTDKVRVHQIRKLSDLGQPRTARPARMGANHGHAATQDPRGLRSLPRQHPREADRVKHGIVAGEPGDQKWSRRVREGGLGKGPQGTSPRPYLSRPDRREGPSREAPLSGGVPRMRRPYRRAWRQGRRVRVLQALPPRRDRGTTNARLGARCDARMASGLRTCAIINGLVANARAKTWRRSAAATARRRLACAIDGHRSVRHVGRAREQTPSLRTDAIDG